METFLELLKLVAVGLIAALFTARIAIRRHREQKWWELRVEAYQSVTNALSDLYHYYDAQLNAMYTNRTITEEKEIELKQMWNGGFHAVRKAAGAGAFLFSDEVDGALKDFMLKHAEDHETFDEYLDSGIAETKKCLDVLVMSSKKDLQLNDTWWNKWLP